MRAERTIGSAIEVPGYRYGSDSHDGLNIDSGAIKLGGDNGELLIDVHVGFGLAEVDQPRTQS